MNRLLRQTAATLASLLAMSAAPAFAQTTGFALPADLIPSTQQAPQVVRQKRIDDASTKKQYTETLAELDKDAASQPRNAQTRFQRGVALAGLGRTDDAIVASGQMTQDFLELPKPYINLAVLYAERGELLRARDGLLMANRVALENTLAQSNLGDVYVCLAAQSYQSMLELNPKNAAARARLDALPDLLGVHPAPRPASTMLPAASGVNAKLAERR